MPKFAEAVIEARRQVEFSDSEVVNFKARTAGREREAEEHWRREREFPDRSNSQTQVWLEKCIKGEPLGSFRVVKAISDKNGLSAYKRELDAVVKFSNEKYSEWFVKSLGWFEIPDEKIFITTEYLSLGSLSSTLSHGPFLSGEEAADVTAQLLSALSFVHAEGMYHGALRPENVHVQSMSPGKWHIKVDDFGICTVPGSVHSHKSELLGYNSESIEIQQAADIFSIGDMIFFLLTKNSPFDDMQLLGSHILGESYFPMGSLRGNQIDDCIIDFIKLMTRPRPENRPTVMQAFTHAWMVPFAPTELVDDDLPPSYEESKNGMFLDAGPSRLIIETSSSSASPSSQSSVLPARPTKKPYIPTLTLRRPDQCIPINYPGIGVQSIEISSDSKTLTLLTPGGAVHLVDLEKATRIKTPWKTDLQCPASVVITCPGRQQAATGSYDGIVRVWDTSMGYILREFRNHSLGISCLGYISNPPLLISGSSDSALTVICLDTWRVRFRLAGHLDRIISIATTEKSGAMIASGSADGTVCLWDPVQGTMLAKVRTLHPCRLAFSPDGVQLASLTSRHKGKVSSWLVSKNARSGGVVRLIPLSSSYKCQEDHLGEDLEEVPCVALGFTPYQIKGQHYPRISYYRGGSKEIQMMLLSSPYRSDVKRCNPRFNDSMKRPHAMAMSPNGRWLATASEQESILRLWDMNGLLYQGNLGFFGMMVEKP